MDNSVDRRRDSADFFARDDWGRGRKGAISKDRTEAESEIAALWVLGAGLSVAASDPKKYLISRGGRHRVASMVGDRERLKPGRSRVWARRRHPSRGSRWRWASLWTTSNAPGRRQRAPHRRIGIAEVSRGGTECGKVQGKRIMLAARLAVPALEGNHEVAGGGGRRWRV